MTGNSNLPTLRWGIIGCGRMSTNFVGDLVLDRPDATTKHIIQAIGSSSKSKAADFASRSCPYETTAFYDAYQDVFDDPNVDIVYIAVPHPFHCSNVMAAIEAGKHVLCEKPAGINAKEAQKMIHAAQQKGVFFMEGMWTRFFPATKKLLSLLHKDKIIGKVNSMSVDLSFNMPFGRSMPNVRTNSRDLGAGAIFDFGIYTFTWASLVFDNDPSRKKNVEPEIRANMLFYNDEEDPIKRIDEQSAVVLKYTDLGATATLSWSGLYQTETEFARIYGEGGSISICGMAAPIPNCIIVKITGQKDERIHFDIKGWGYHFEADAVADAIRAGSKQSDLCSWDHTLAILKQMDKTRELCKVLYPSD